MYIFYVCKFLTSYHRHILEIGNLEIARSELRELTLSERLSAIAAAISINCSEIDEILDKTNETCENIDNVLSSVEVQIVEFEDIQRATTSETCI